MKTRSNSQIISNCFRTKVCQQSLKFVGPKLWSKIPSRSGTAIQATPSEKKLTQHLARFPNSLLN